MATVEIRCYAELNDFLPVSRRQRAFARSFSIAGSVKDTLESLGVPHPEIDLILVNGVSPVHLPLPPEARFLLDGHLGRLARHLHLLGFAADHQAEADDAALAAAAAAGDRILLTRDLDLLKRTIVRRGYRVRATDPVDQAVEVVRRFDLAGRLAPFTRCLPCGACLEEVTAQEAADRVPPGVASRHADYRRCPACGRLYWAGSHYRRLAALVDRIRRAADDPHRSPA
jgi:hypothetical protein